MTVNHPDDGFGPSLMDREPGESLCLKSMPESEGHDRHVPTSVLGVLVDDHREYGLLLLHYIPSLANSHDRSNRSLSACLRCRRQKLKCGGPGKVPCRRCRSSGSECVFVPPRAGHAGSAASDIDVKTALLEQRLESMERQMRLEIESVRAEVARVSPNSSNLRQGLSPHPPPVALLTAEKGAQSASTGTDEWDELYAFFCTNCSAIVAVIDDQLHSPAETVRKHPLMSAVICAIASKVVCPVRHQSYVSEVDRLIMKTFKGPISDLLGVQAMIIFAAWTGRTRLMGYIASVATELKLHEAAVLIGDETTEHTPDLIGRARTWFTLCCLDLQTNISRPFVINNMREYLQYAKYLAMSPYHRPVDERICTYIKGFTIAGNVKGQLKNSQLKSKPLLPGVAKLLASSDEQVDQWFHETNNNIHPLYQTFPDRQDRNRFLIIEQCV